MVGASSMVDSPQQDIHPRLNEILARHRHSTFRKPLARHTLVAFEQVSECLAERDAPLVLDSGCGTGASTRLLAQRHPECWVIGVDRSADRLSRSGCQDLSVSGNCVLLRADLVDFWILARRAGWRLATHYFLYPNPYPKPGQVMRRWHAHPVFPTIVALGGVWELRTNWRVYALEFARALAVHGRAGEVEAWQPDGHLSPFERKYALSEHPLYRVRSPAPH